MVITLGGRPIQEGGHEPRRLSLDEPTRRILDLASGKGRSMSKLVENCVKTMGKQYDPGPACETVAKILAIVEEDIDRARNENEFDRLQALAALRRDLQPYVGACELAKPNDERSHAR